MTEQTTFSEPPSWLSPLADELRKLQQSLTVDAAKEILQRVKSNREIVEQESRFDDRFYTRTSVLRTPHVEVLLMGWLPGQVSPLHNHRGSVCAVKVLMGSALEVSYERTGSGYLAPSEIDHFLEGAVTASEDEAVHQLGNCQTTRLVTLHIYSPPLTRADVFSDDESILTHDACESMVSVASVDMQGNTQPHPY